MTGRLVYPADALAALRDKARKRWADAVCAEHGIGEPVTFSVSLRPGVGSSAAVERIGFDVWHEWTAAWRAFAGAAPEGVRVEHRPVTIQRVAGSSPATLVAADLDHALDPAAPVALDTARARDLAASLSDAGANLRPALLRAAYDLAPADAEMLHGVIVWLSENPDASSWTARQLPVPGLHSKWLEKHGGLLRQATGRDVRAEVRERPAVVHLTYVCPTYASTSGGRRHDAWTTGDGHEPAYVPRTVLVVENRDSRLWFPEVERTVVVEGGGKAAASLLSDVAWVREAEHLVYWGDMDADGYAILDRFRSVLGRPSASGRPARAVPSILMDDTDLDAYARHGVLTDKNGMPLKPSSVRLGHLTPDETAAYDAITTAGEVPFRRIEQELIPLQVAAERLRTLVAGRAGG